MPNELLPLDFDPNAELAGLHAEELPLDTGWALFSMIDRARVMKPPVVACPAPTSAPARVYASYYDQRMAELNELRRWEADTMRA